MAMDAITVVSAHKSYGDNIVLRGLNMNVQKGHIYGLLGSSGCGKTTLLSCIVGRRHLESGTILVCGAEPGTVTSGVPGHKIGYMPQETALVGEFTVRDAAYYFGRVLNVPHKVIAERFSVLSNVLDLPPANRFLKDCSGGQQRRISLAVSLIHHPEILIMDEPTVGVDPLLREKIWMYIQDLTEKTKTTVILTTHYIEEANKADMIGIMRDGMLLTQESPAKLMSKYNTNYLEDVFFLLSKQQEEGTLETYQNLGENSGNAIPDSKHSSAVSLDIDYGSRSILDSSQKKSKRISGLELHSNRVGALFNKNMKQFYRNWSGIFVTLGMPVVSVVAFMLAIGGNVRDVHVGIVSGESCSNYSRNTTVISAEDYQCFFNDLTCRFMTYLDDPMIKKIRYNSIDEGLVDVRKGWSVALLSIPENFTESFQAVMMDERRIDKKTREKSEVKVWIDLSNLQIGETLKFKLLTAYQTFLQEIMKDCNYSPKSKTQFDFIMLNGRNSDTFNTFMVPGLIMTVSFFFAAITNILIIIKERLEGIWERSAVAGVTAVEITFTHFVIQSVVVLLQNIEVFLIIFWWFKTETNGDFLSLGVLSYLQGLAGMTFGFLVSIASDYYTTANIIGSGVFYIMIFSCGVIWPIQAIPYYLQPVIVLLPFTIPIDSFRNVMKKGWPFSHFTVYRATFVEIIWIIIFTILTIIITRARR